MTIEERFYSCGMNTVVDPRGIETSSPAILEEPEVIRDSFGQRDIDGDVCYKVGATPEAWAEFDARFPNQDADTGSPYRRRFPRKDIPFVDFTP